MFKVAVLPGDGIGPEVVNEGMKVLKALSENYSVQFDFQEIRHQLGAVPEHRQAAHRRGRGRS